MIDLHDRIEAIAIELRYLAADCDDKRLSATLTSLATVLMAVAGSAVGEIAV